MQIRAKLSHAAAILLLVSAVFICSFSQPQAFTQADFDKLRPIMGTWLAKRSQGTVYETWSGKSKSELAGKSYTMDGPDTVMLETVRLYMHNGEIIYAPVTAGQNNEQEVLFKLTSIEKGRVFVFENRLHDFPQKIVYDFKTPDSLLAYIEGKVKGQSRRVDYPYKRMH